MMDCIISEVSVICILNHNITNMIEQCMTIEVNNIDGVTDPWETLRDKIISSLDFIYEQIAEYMGMSNSKIINKEYPIMEYDVGVSINNLFLYKSFSLDQLIEATLFVGHFIGINQYINNIVCITFAHNGTIFSVGRNDKSNETHIIKCCSDLPQSILSLEFILKQFTDAWNKYKKDLDKEK